MTTKRTNIKNALRCAGPVWVILVSIAGASAANSSYPPPVDRSASRTAQGAYDRAMAELRQEQGQLDRVVREKIKEFEASAAFIEAQEAAKSAQRDYELLRDPIFEKLRRMPAYIAAQEREAEAKKRVEKLRDSPSKTEEEWLAATRDVMEFGTRVNRMEAAAIEASSEAMQAKARFMEAAAKVPALRTSFEVSLKDDQAWREQKQRITDAESKCKPLKETLVAALRTEEAAERQRQQQIAAIDRQRAADAAARARRGRRR